MLEGLGADGTVFVDWGPPGEPEMQQEGQFQD